MNIASKTLQPACSALSLEAGEGLAGTAIQVSAYFLLEYNGPWGAKAFEESDLPQDVKAHLDAQMRSVPGARLQLIKRAVAGREAGVRFFAAVVNESDPALYAFELTGYEGLLALDLASIISDAEAYRGRKVEHPIFLVCTNGRRDPCCARAGVPVFNALEDVVKVGDIPGVWQTTHVGGHRFAANLLCLPEGLLYGRVEPSDLEAILGAHRRQQVYPPNLRGRVCYPDAAQAAEIHLRRQSGELSISAFHLLGVSELEPERWAVEFVHPFSGERHHLFIKVKLSGRAVFESCALEKQTPIKEYQLESYHVSQR